MPEILVGGGTVHFQDTMRPSRHTVVFLHGAGGSHHTWRDQWAGLKGTARLVIPDLPGHAGSRGDPMESVDGYTTWLREFLGEAGIREFVLAGHSMGGAIALQAAIQKVPGIRALVLVATGAKLRVSPAITEGIAGRYREFAPELVGMMLAEPPDPDLRDDLIRDVLSTRPDSYRADFRACDAFDVRDRIGQIRVPTLVISGDRDRLTPLRYGEYLATNIPGAVLKILHGAGHAIPLEKPAETNAVIASFLHSLEE